MKQKTESSFLKSVNQENKQIMRCRFENYT